MLCIQKRETLKFNLPVLLETAKYPVGQLAE